MFKRLTVLIGFAVLGIALAAWGGAYDGPEAYAPWTWINCGAGANGGPTPNNGGFGETGDPGRDSR